MKLERIALYNFRNLAHTEFAPDSGLNLIIGPNAAGKSNLCEAIYYVAKGWLFKGERQRDLIAWGHQETALECAIDGDQARIHLNGSVKTKTIEINRERKSQSELSSLVRAVIFTPDELHIIKGSPDQRRRFLDHSIADLNREYRHVSLEYEHVVRRKNVLLRNGAPNREVLEVFNEELVDRGNWLINRRRTYVNDINRTLSERYQKISDRSTQLVLKYETTVSDTDDIRTELTQLVKQATREELRRGTTLVGPHRDDLHFELDGRDLRRFGSQGEQKSALCAALLAQLDLHHGRFGDYPILILDDVLSELDSGRMQRLLQLLPRGVQIFLTQTVTDVSEIQPEARAAANRVFALKDGQLSVIV
jgi:DNA replication and repair protein RecF